VGKSVWNVELCAGLGGKDDDDCAIWRRLTHSKRDDESRSRRSQTSYLALDVYFAECSSTKLLEPGCGLAELHSELVTAFLVRFLLDEVLGAMRIEEFTTRFVVIECELIGQESKGDIYVASTCQRGRGVLVSVHVRSGHVSESSESLTLDEHVHQVTAHVLCLEVQSEELVVVAECQC